MNFNDYKSAADKLNPKLPAKGKHSFKKFWQAHGSAPDLEQQWQAFLEDHKARAEQIRRNKELANALPVVALEAKTITIETWGWFNEGNI